MQWSYILYVIDTASTKGANIIPTNVTSIVSITCQNKKVRYEMDYTLLERLLIIIA